MQTANVTIEDMIIEGSMSAQHAVQMGYRWNAAVVGGDALVMRNSWLVKRQTING